MGEEDISDLVAQEIDIDGPAALVGAAADDQLDVDGREAARLLDEVVELLVRAEPLQLIEAVVVLHHAEEEPLQPISLALVQLASALSEQVRKCHVNGV